MLLYYTGNTDKVSNKAPVITYGLNEGGAECVSREKRSKNKHDGGMLCNHLWFYLWIMYECACFIF